MIVDKILSCTDNELTIRVFDSTGFPHINDTRKIRPELVAAMLFYSKTKPDGGIPINKAIHTSPADILILED